MALEANLGVLTVKKHQEVIKTNDLAEKQAVLKEVDKIGDLQTNFLDSAAGKKIKESLEAIKNETADAEGKKNKLVVLMKDFFEVGSGDDESIQRFLDDAWKRWLRINSGSEIFDISLEWTDIKWLINWLIGRYLDRAASVVNGDEADAEKQISLKYEEDKLVIEEIEQDLATLEAQVTWWTPSVAVSWVWLRDRVKEKREGFKKWIRSFDDLKTTTRDRVSSKFTMVTSAIGSFAGISSMMAAKDPTKAAASKRKWDDFWNTLTWFKNTLASAFGIWPKPPSTSPSTPEWMLT